MKITLNNGKITACIAKFKKIIKKLNSTLHIPGCLEIDVSSCAASYKSCRTIYHDTSLYKEGERKKVSE